jgi:hypothetical protein
MIYTIAFAFLLLNLSFACGRARGRVIDHTENVNTPKPNRAHAKPREKMKYKKLFFLLAVK